jgi:hypothetical protein
MILLRIVVAALVCASAGSAWAQEWIEFRDQSRRFHVNFPGQPTVRDTTWEPHRDEPMPARVYSAQMGPARYSLTVVDLTGLRQGMDVKGAVAWEAWKFRKRGGKVVYDMFAMTDNIDGHHIFINNDDGTVTTAAIHQHERRLYILEANAPPNTPGAHIFYQSLAILDDEGKVIRYRLDKFGNQVGRESQESDN